MHKHSNPSGVPVMLLSLLLCPIAASPAMASAAIDEIVVTTQRRDQSRLEYAGNIDRLDRELIASVQHQHIHELLSRVAGVWIDRMSGQEYLTAIRSPVLSGPGSCGSFLLLEDGIPVRPAGFCNVNQFFEVVTEQAQSIEVIRGPGDAVYGSNALHGIVNTLMPEPGPAGAPAAAVEIGSNRYFRGRAQLPLAGSQKWLASLLFADDGGFRDDSGYTQYKLHAKRAISLDSGGLMLGFSATDLDQDTAGSISGFNAYTDPALNRSNPNPEAFRRASAQRLYGRWTRPVRGFELDVRPFLRHSNMDFLQHFLPGKPLEENGHISTGVLTSLSRSRSGRQTDFGIDIEWSDMFLKETQADPAEGSAFLVETRPQGKHYDYDVTSFNAAIFYQTSIELAERWTLGIGGRLETMQYRYDNRMLDGNTRDDGSECGFGGCLYTRPADRDDSFTDFAPKLSLRFALRGGLSAYARLTRGFRAPQTTELYRLQSGQSVADLVSERIDSLELGLVSVGGDVSLELAVFAMRKRDSIFRDSEGFNVSGARTRHDGIEASLDWSLSRAWSLGIDATYARHRYDFNSAAAGGSTFVSGRDVDTAPRWLGSIELGYAGNGRFSASLQWLALGEYFLEPANAFRYPGHALANLRAGIRLTPDIKMIGRVNNLFDRDIADRADYAFGSYRYWPGRGRELFLEFQYAPRNESL